MLDKRNIEINNFKGKIFKGIVVDNNDPLKLSRIKVYINALFDAKLKTNPENLPWVMSLGFMSSTNYQCNVDVPDINTECYVIYPGDDVYSGIYLSSVPNTALEFLENYPYCYGRVDRSGTLFIANTNDDTYMLYHSSGTCLTIDGFGKIKVQVANCGDANKQAKSLNPKGISFEVIGDINLDCTDNVNVHCKNFFVDALESISLKSKIASFDFYNTSIKSTNNLDISTSTFTVDTRGAITLAGGADVKLSATSMLSLYGGTVGVGNAGGGTMITGTAPSQFDSYPMREYTITAITSISQDSGGNVSSTSTDYKIRAFEIDKVTPSPGTQPVPVTPDYKPASSASNKIIRAKPNRQRQAYVPKKGDSK